MEEYCISCGMPLENKEDIAVKTNDGPACKFCVDSENKIKSCEEIFEGGVKFFSSSVPGVNKELAERVTRKNMNRLPYWKGNGNECLKGEEATDNEFYETLAKLHEEIKKGNINV